MADAVILTGLSYPNPEKDAAVSGVGWGPTAFRAKIANTVDPKKWPKAEYDNGYIVFADIYGHIDTFFRTYERDVAEYADSIVAPLAVSEHASLGFLDLHAPSYRGKVFLTSGENDILGCGGDCKSTFAMGLQGEVWKGVSRFEYYVHPGAGHGVNFNKGAGVFFGKIFGFLDREV